MKMEEELLKSKLLISDFPECTTKILSLHRCETRNIEDLYVLPKESLNDSTKKPLETLTKKSNPCIKEKSEMLWCLLSTICSEEVKIFQDCMGSSFPWKYYSNRVPLKCNLEWRSLDKCLISKSTELENGRK